MKCESLKGLNVSQGIAIGKAFLYESAAEAIPEAAACVDSSQELALLGSATAAARGELTDRIASFSSDEEEKRGIFEAHLEILDDPCMDESIRTKITDESLSCRRAIWDGYQEIINAMLGLDDPVFSGRAADMKDVRNRLLRCCDGLPEPDLSALSSPVILLAKDLAPSDTACLPREYVLGIAAETGGATSHTAILARSCGIPAILGVPELLSTVKNGDTVILDAFAGELLCDPSEDTIKEYSAKLEIWKKQCAEDEVYLKSSAVTMDGTAVLTEVNIGAVADAYAPAVQYADGAGLLRTEFLYMGADALPDEETQYRAYAEILRAFGEKPVILRTLDIGGDKQLPYLELPKEQNPFLGVRALRFCFANEGLFRTQLRAAYRAAACGNLWIMFPMVGSLEDFRRAKELCISVQAELEAEGVPYGKDVPLGIMIEIPSIALAADLAAKETDFASIGTNDLCQYVCAADRMNPDTAPYYRNCDPGLLRLIGYVARSYAAEGKPVGVCGELAGNPETAKLLVGLGIRTLSMNSGSLGAVRRAITESKLDGLTAAAEAAQK